MLLEKISYLKIETKVNNLNIIFTNKQVSKLTKHGIDFIKYKGLYKALFCLLLDL